MSAQNCQARLLFKNFTITIDYAYQWNENSFISGYGTFINKAQVNGTWGHKPLKLNFTKRELSCPNLLSETKTKAIDGWAHKQIDLPIVRDFGMGYPYPAFGQGTGQEYSANYYVDQRYPNETGYTPEAVPLIDKLRTRQAVLPRINTAYQPFYFLEESGFPPNLDQEHFALTPDTAVFDTKETYKAWLQTWLASTRSPVYFPGAPNDPEPTANPRKVPTLFPNKAAWLAFRDSAGGQGNSLCGGNAQCGIDFKLVHDPLMVLNASTLRSFIGSDGGYSNEGTAITQQNPLVELSYMDLFSKPASENAYVGYTRTPQKNNDDKYKIDAYGNILFNEWVNNPANDSKAQYLKNLVGKWNTTTDELKGFPFFNKNQKICAQFREYVKNIPLPQKWTLYPVLGGNFSWEQQSPKFATFLFGNDAGWNKIWDTVFTETGNTLIWQMTGNSSQSDSGFNYSYQADFSISCTVTWTWTDL
jgi:hypothetical protein